MSTFTEMTNSDKTDKLAKALTLQLDGAQHPSGTALSLACGDAFSE